MTKPWNVSDVLWEHQDAAVDITLNFLGCNVHAKNRAAVLVQQLGFQQYTGRRVTQCQ